jgi:tetratricopeptide (TPR) repeat protein
LGHAYALAGRIPEALPLLQQAVEQWNTIRGTAGQAFRLVSLSEAHLLAGRADDALRFATQALDLARTYRERGYHAYALRALAESASHQKPIDADHAQSYYREALRLSEELEMQPLLAHSHFGLGRFYRSQAEHRHADEHFILAADLFRSMDMPLWSMKVELELKDLRLRH